MALSSKRVVVSLDRDAHAALHSAKIYTGQTLSNAIDSAVWDFVEKTDERIATARKTGVGSYRAAAAIRKMSAAEKDALVESNRKALATAGIDDND